MELLETVVGRRGRKRKFPRNESAQPSSFPRTPEPAVAERLELNAEEKEKARKAAAQIPEIFTPDQVEWVFDVYVGIISFVYSLVLKCPFDEIHKELEFSKDQKESLAKPLAKVLSKHAPAEWAGSTAEIQLIMTMGIWTVASFQRARNVQKKLEEDKKDKERTQPVQPMRRQPVSEIHVPA